MVKKNRLSHDQKRKAKLAREARHAPHHDSLAYKGNKYKKPELVPVFLQTELRICEAYVMTDRKLTDRLVRSTLEKLILQMRHAPLPPLEDRGTAKFAEGQEEDLIVHRIRSKWRDIEPRPSVDNLIGVLRTTLNSINVWSSSSPESRGYLQYLEGFMAKGGIALDLGSAERDQPPEPADPELLEIGRAWCHEGDQEAAHNFRELAMAMIANGAAQTVVEVCHRLMGELGSGREMGELMVLSLEAQKAVRLG